MHKLTRICYNSQGWRSPTGEAESLETNSFCSENGFGFEEWIFRDEWLLDGYRYTFLQGANVGHRDYVDEPLHLSLYTLTPNKSRLWVAQIWDAQWLEVPERDTAQRAYVQNGWLTQMENEVALIGAAPNVIHDTDKTTHYLNLRYRPENLVLFPEGIELPDGARSRVDRYQFFNSSPERQLRLAELYPEMGPRLLAD